MKACVLKLTSGLAFLVFLAIGCSHSFNSGTQARISTKQNAATIAVLDFEQEGFLGSEKLSRYAADELTTALFLKRKLDVVDRAQVKAKLLAMNLSVTALQNSEVTTLGRSLGADYLIFGKLSRLDEQDFDPERNENLHVQISFRVIAAKDGAVIGVVTRREKSQAEPRKFISDMLNNMARAVKLKR